MTLGAKFDETNLRRSLWIEYLPRRQELQIQTEPEPILAKWRAASGAVLLPNIA